MRHQGSRVCRPLSQPRVQAVGIRQEQSAGREKGKRQILVTSGQRRPASAEVWERTAWDLRAAGRGGHGRSAATGFTVLPAGQQRGKKQSSGLLQLRLLVRPP